MIAMIMIIVMLVMISTLNMFVTLLQSQWCFTRLWILVSPALPTATDYDLFKVLMPVLEGQKMSIASTKTKARNISIWCWQNMTMVIQHYFLHMHTVLYSNVCVMINVQSVYYSISPSRENTASEETHAHAHILKQWGGFISNPAAGSPIPESSLLKFEVIHSQNNHF